MTAPKTGTDLAFAGEDLAEREPRAVSTAGASSPDIGPETRGQTDQSGRAIVGTQALVRSDREPIPDRQTRPDEDGEAMTDTDQTGHRPAGRPSLTAPGEHTKQRGVRIPDEEWYASVALAKAEGTTISSKIRDLLREWRETAESGEES